MRIIIIGSGNAVYFLTRQLMERHHHVTVINRNQANSQRLARQTRATVVVGDGTDVDILEEAGVRRADVVLALTPHDQDNLIACQIVKNMYNVPRTLALVNDPDNEPIFRALGVEQCFSATRTIASLIEQHASLEDAFLVPLAQGRVNITDVSLDEDAPAVGKTLRALAMPEHSLVACIIRGNQTIVPDGDTRLFAEDRLIVITDPQDHVEALARLLGEQR